MMKSIWSMLKIVKQRLKVLHNSDFANLDQRISKATEALNQCILN